MNEELEQQAINLLKLVQRSIHETAKSKGWWKKLDAMKDKLGATELSAHADELYMMARTMLQVTELAEAVEGLRAGNPPDDKVPEFNSFEVEQADCIIRALDMAEKFNLRVIEAVFAKMKMNEGRAYMHGGKTI